MKRALLILVFLGIKNVNGIQSTHAKRNQGHVLTNLHKWIGESTSVGNYIEELT